MDGVKPTLSELEKFQETASDLRMERNGHSWPSVMVLLRTYGRLVASTTIQGKAHSFAPGDSVEVAEGELMNLRGKVQSVDGDRIVMLPEHEDLKVQLQF